jgi:DNA-binding NarL/FixJ family response regulator
MRHPRGDPDEPGELEVLHHLARSSTNQEVAVKLHLSMATVRTTSPTSSTGSS